MTISVGRLKAVKNAVIGNPKTKASLAQDPVLLSALIEALPDPALVAEAAHVVASLALGSDAALHALLVAHAPRALLFALASHNEPQARAALARALRVLAASIADAVGPALWGLARTPFRELRAAAASARDALCAPEALDIYLPLLSTPSPAATAVAQLLGTLLRTPAQRSAVTNWTPSPVSPEQTTRSRRGWEKTAAATTPVVPVVAKWLATLLDAPGRNIKMDEAALYALAALAQENPTVAGYLGRSDPLPLNAIIAFAKSRSAEVQVAACLCITHTLRSMPPRPTPSSHPHPRHSHSHSVGASYPHTHMPTNHSLVHTHTAGGSSSHTAPPSLEETGVRTVLNVVNRILSAAPAESPLVRMRACFVLHYLVADDQQLCNAALDRGCLDALGSLILALGPTEPAPLEWEEAEAAATQALREAAFTALASLALASDDVRRRISSPPLSLFPSLSRALRATHVGTRYAAAQCVRAMSRSVSVLRTSVVDTGLGMDVLRIVLGQPLSTRFGGNGASSNSNANTAPGARVVDAEVKRPVGVVPLGEGGDFLRGEDRRVLGAALSAVCNIVNDFSPLRPIYLEENLVPRLVELLRASGDGPLQVSALWAVKNLVRKASKETKRDVMQCVGWSELLGYLTESEPALHEQALNLARNLTENEEAINLVLENLPPPILVPLLGSALRTPSSPDAAPHAAAALANLANGPAEVQIEMCTSPGLLSALASALSGSAGPGARAPAAGCVLALAKGDPRRRKEMAEAGILQALRGVVAWGVAPPVPTPVSAGAYGTFGVGSPGSAGVGVLHSALGGRSMLGAGGGGAGEEARDIVQRAEMALQWLKPTEGYGHGSALMGE